MSRFLLRGVLTVTTVVLVAAMAIAADATRAFSAFSNNEETTDSTVAPTQEPEPEPTVKPTEKPKPIVAAIPAIRRPRITTPIVAPKPKSFAAVAPSSSGGSANYTALLIGVNHAPGSTTLEGSITDVNNMRDALLKFGFKRQNIKILTEGAANRNAILGALDSLAARTSGKGLAVFLLATHSGQSGGDLTFATGGGGRISRHELAARLGKVRGKLWSTLATCYSQGYSIPGVVGKNRVAVFSSSAGNYSYQLGSAGSWVVLYMIDYALIEGRAKTSTIEGAFRWAKKELEKDNPDRAPIISDSIAGDVSIKVA